MSSEAPLCLLLLCLVLSILLRTLTQQGGQLSPHRLTVSFLAGISLTLLFWNSMAIQSARRQLHYPRPLSLSLPLSCPLALLHSGARASRTTPLQRCTSARHSSPRHTQTL
jgi:hypothetical protein